MKPETERRSTRPSEWTTAAVRVSAIALILIVFLGLLATAKLEFRTVPPNPNGSEPAMSAADFERWVEECARNDQSGVLRQLLDELEASEHTHIIEAWPGYGSERCNNIYTPQTMNNYGNTIPEGEVVPGAPPDGSGNAPTGTGLGTGSITKIDPNLNFRYQDGNSAVACAVLVHELTHAALVDGGKSDPRVPSEVAELWPPNDLRLTFTVPGHTGSYTSIFPTGLLAWNTPYTDTAGGTSVGISIGAMPSFPSSTAFADQWLAANGGPITMTPAGVTVQRVEWTNNGSLITVHSREEYETTRNENGYLTRNGYPQRTVYGTNKLPAASFPFPNDVTFEWELTGNGQTQTGSTTIPTTVLTYGSPHMVPGTQASLMFTANPDGTISVSANPTDGSFRVTSLQWSIQGESAGPVVTPGPGGSVGAGGPLDNPQDWDVVDGLPTDVVIRYRITQNLFGFNCTEEGVVEVPDWGEGGLFGRPIALPFPPIGGPFPPLVGRAPKLDEASITLTDLGDGTISVTITTDEQEIELISLQWTINGDPAGEPWIPDSSIVVPPNTVPPPIDVPNPIRPTDLPDDMAIHYALMVGGQWVEGWLLIPPGELNYWQEYALPTPSGVGIEVVGRLPEASEASIRVSPGQDGQIDVRATRREAAVRIMSIQWTLGGHLLGDPITAPEPEMPLIEIPPASTGDNPRERETASLPRRWPPNDVHISFAFLLSDGSRRTGTLDLATGELEYGKSYGIPVPTENGQEITPTTPGSDDAQISIDMPEGGTWPTITGRGSTEAGFTITRVEWTYDGEPIGSFTDDQGWMWPQHGSDAAPSPPVTPPPTSEEPPLEDEPRTAPPPVSPPPAAEPPDEEDEQSSQDTPPPITPGEQAHVAPREQETEPVNSCSRLIADVIHLSEAEALVSGECCEASSAAAEGAYEQAIEGWNRCYGNRLDLLDEFERLAIGMPLFSDQILVAAEHYASSVEAFSQAKSHWGSAIAHFQAGRSTQGSNEISAGNEAIEISNTEVDAAWDVLLELEGTACAIASSNDPGSVPDSVENATRRIAAATASEFRKEGRHWCTQVACLTGSSIAVLRELTIWTRSCSADASQTSDARAVLDYFKGADSEQRDTIVQLFMETFWRS
ncbi:MAG: hypothetical protein ACTSYX_08095 [Candidatus Thorarchaeota archaeon]